MHSFTTILDTRPRGSRHGVGHRCTCGRLHRVWACFREVEAHDVPGNETLVHYVLTGKTLVVGVGCAREVQVPVWETYKVAAALEDPQRTALHPGDEGYGKLFQEFR